MSNHRSSVSSKVVREWVIAALLLILSVAFFSKLVLGNLVMTGLDVFTYFYPYKAYAAETLRSGSLPLWNPYLFMGVPFLANLQSAVLYPLNVPFYWLPAPQMVNCSILLHVFMAAVFTYAFARRALSFGPWGSLVSAATLAFGGFLGAQVEHVNQLSTLAWLPLLLWLFYLSHTTRRLVYVLLTGVIIGVQFLAGHTQSSYINLMGLGCYALYLPLARLAGNTSLSGRSVGVGRRLGRSLRLLVLVVLLGAALASVQLVPTYELSRLSIRSAGLPYRQAVSFSLHPGTIHLSLLPSLADSPFSEYVAYVGILPLLLGMLGVWRRRHSQQAPFFIALSALGLFLALGVYNPFYYLLYRLVPGFGLFRVPARWLYLYTVGIAILAGLGFEELFSLSSSLARPRKRWALVGCALGSLVICRVLMNPPSPVLVLYWVAWATLAGMLLWVGLRRQRGIAYLFLVTSLVIGELFFASRYLAYNRVTAPEAFSSLRPSIAHLLTDSSVYRLLSFSDGDFDPGDLREIEQNLGQQLPQEAVYDYQVATKQKEILTPNLPLLYQLQSVDGYDGGVLPLAGYVAWQRLLLPEDQISVDGRLQGRITEMPSARVLTMCNAKYVITDKVYDVWVDGAYYDLAHRAILGGNAPHQLILSDLPPFPTTALGVVSYLVGGEGVPQGTVVAEITVADDDGHSRTFQLRAGEDTAQGEYSTSTPLHREARVVGHWRGNPAGNDYHALLDLGDAIYPSQIEVKFAANQGQLRLRGMTLLDQRTGTHRALVVSAEGRYRLVHSGDVKIYENLDVLPRAFVVHKARVLEKDDEVLAALLDETFDPGTEVLLHGEQSSTESYGERCESEAVMVSYAPERVTIEARTDCPGYLVLTDAHYPGWLALMDERPQEILRANYYFRGVFLPQGEHVVEFLYQPASFRIGLTLSALTIVFLLAGFAWHPLRSWLSTC